MIILVLLRLRERMGSPRVAATALWCPHFSQWQVAKHDEKNTLRCCDRAGSSQHPQVFQCIHLNKPRHGLSRAVEHHSQVLWASARVSALHTLHWLQIASPYSSQSAAHWFDYSSQRTARSVVTAGPGRTSSQLSNWWQRRGLHHLELGCQELHCGLRDCPCQIFSMV